jgi:hypothetical protein
MDKIARAFIAGYRWGVDYGPASPREAEGVLASLELPTSDAVVMAFCCGSDDGYIGDTWRLAAVAHRREMPTIKLEGGE